MSAEKTMGTKLYLVDSGDDQIADLNVIGEVGGEAEEIDTTTLDSSDGYKESIPGLKDAGEVACEAILKSEANAGDLLDMFEAQEVHNWEERFNSGAKWAFSAWVKTFKEGQATIDGKRTFKFNLRVVGKPVYTPSEEVSA